MERTVKIGVRQSSPPNKINNQKYNLITFVPLVLYNQFKYFFNLFFLAVVISQLIPTLRVNYLFSSVAPLAFVVIITMIKEAYDDLQRMRRDAGLNAERVRRLTTSGVERCPSSALSVGDVVVLEAGERAPADLIVLSSQGSVFIRTDQLDGEIDWKLRTPILGEKGTEPSLFGEDCVFTIEPPHKDIHSFYGSCVRRSVVRVKESIFGEECSDVSNSERRKESAYTDGRKNQSILSRDQSLRKRTETHGVGDSETKNLASPIFENLKTENVTLTVDYTAWANTVLCSGSLAGLVIYTGKDTRAAMNTNRAVTKNGKLDIETNNMAKALFALMITISLAILFFKNTGSLWYLELVRLIVLFSTIVPISLRVNLELAKAYYSVSIARDERIAGVAVRNSSLAEELGRIDFVLTDKTGTLTKNEMILKKIHMGTLSISTDDVQEVRRHILGRRRRKVQRRDLTTRIHDVAIALSVCHNVTLVEGRLTSSSPDEIAITEWTNKVGLTLSKRTAELIELKLELNDENGESAQGTETASASESCRGKREEDEKTSQSTKNNNEDEEEEVQSKFSNEKSEESYIRFRILYIFPFSSELKRMGIVVEIDGVAYFFCKGADSVIGKMVKSNDWLDEASTNMARDGLRTLAVARRKLSTEVLREFEAKYSAAQRAVDRNQLTREAISLLETGCTLLCVTGVEDRLQDNLFVTFEKLRSAKIKLWMLTGDKVETASCIATSSKMFSRSGRVHRINRTADAFELQEHIRILQTRQYEYAVVDGLTLDLFLRHFRIEFLDATMRMSAIVCCRCTPTQKAEVARALMTHTGKSVLCVGDGGNDVSMIQTASVGVGIEGKEGRQASLAADFSIKEYQHLVPLLFWHGRNSYRGSARLSQLIIHRGLLLAVVQAVFSVANNFCTVSVYGGMISVGFVTLYTFLPILSIIIDYDVRRYISLAFPEVYAELKRGDVLCVSSFLRWLSLSIYQGGIIACASMLQPSSQHSGVTESFTALAINELLLVILLCDSVHYATLSSIIISAVTYILSFVFIRSELVIPYRFFVSTARVILMTVLCSLPLFCYKVWEWYAIPSHRKLEV